jgi:hypothetical protein
MPSLTRLPMTCPDAQTTSVRQLPSARLAPNMASAITTGHGLSGIPVTKAETIRDPTGSCIRLLTLVLDQVVNSSCCCGVSSA